MNRHERYLAAKKKTEGLPLFEEVRFTAETFRLLAEEEKRFSETRLERLVGPSAVNAFDKAVTTLIRAKGLRVRVTEDPDDLPELSQTTRFKYSSRTSGNLHEIQGCMKRGEDAAVAWVEEDGLVIGYGLAFLRKPYTEITIIDVDVYSRRNHGLSTEFEVKGEFFSVGVGHAVVRAILKQCPSPFRTDATNHHSRYIFKSFGFTQRPAQSNPCLLELREY